MICPFCAANDDRVVDSRSTDNSRVIRRRRICNHCSKRFTTYERIESAVRLMVIKRDQSRQAFDIQKMLGGLEAACGKLPIPSAEKLRLVEEVEEHLYQEYDREVPSIEIGARIAARLRLLNLVAYVRFVSVYKEFSALDQFIDEVQDLRARVRAELPGQGSLFAMQDGNAPAPSEAPSAGGASHESDE